MIEQHEPWLIALRLSKAGFGFPEDIREWDAQKTLQALNYLQFVDDYESTYIELNKKTD